MGRFTKLAVLAAIGAAPALLVAQLPRTEIDGPQLWTDPVPGQYLIGVESSGLCVSRTSGSLSTQLPHMVLQPCNADNFAQDIELVPNGSGAPPLDGASTMGWRFTIRGECLTAARDVLLGAPSVDQIRCGTRNGEWRESRMGAMDQSWRLRRANAAGHFEVRSVDGRCWTAQGGNLTAGTQLVMEPCDGRLGQHFEFAVLQGDVTNDLNRLAVESFGWFLLPQPLRDVPRRYRAMPHLNLPSGDYTQGMVTANDEGLQCAQACAEDSRCKGFTWVDPRARGGRPMCYKKDRINTPVADDFTNSGIVRM